MQPPTKLLLVATLLPPLGCPSTSKPKTEPRQKTKPDAVSAKLGLMVLPLIGGNQPTYWGYQEARRRQERGRTHYQKNAYARAATDFLQAAELMRGPPKGSPHTTAIGKMRHILCYNGGVALVAAKARARLDKALDRTRDRADKPCTTGLEKAAKLR